MPESTWQRACKDTENFRQTTKSFWLVEVMGGAVFGALGGIVGGWLTPTNATVFWQNLYPTVAAAIGLVLGFVLVFVGIFVRNLFRAPYRQRNEARARVQQLLDEAQQLEDETRPRLAVFIEKKPVWGGSVPLGQQQSVFWRLGVKNISLSPISRCYSEILTCYMIGENNKTIPEGTWPREGHILPWARMSGEQRYERDFARDEIAYVDYIMIHDIKAGILYVPSLPDSSNQRPNYTSYQIAWDDLEFEIAVGSKESKMNRSVIKFKFEWKGGENAIITELDNTSPKT